MSNDAVACPRCGWRSAHGLPARIVAVLIPKLVLTWAIGLGVAGAVFIVSYNAVNDRTVPRSGTGQAITDVAGYIGMAGSAALAVGTLLFGATMVVFEIRHEEPGVWKPVEDRLTMVWAPLLSFAAVCAFGLLGCGIAALILTGW